MQRGQGGNGFSGPSFFPNAHQFTINGGHFYLIVQHISGQRPVSFNHGGPPQTMHNFVSDSVIIAVMGVSGSGKSTFPRSALADLSQFIQLITGDDPMGTDNGDESTNLQSFDFIEPASGRKVIIIDTPGFGDSEVSDTDILKKISNFLWEEYGAMRKLNGLVYLQRISNPKFGVESRLNLRLFKQLCESGTCKNVVVLTTFWDRLSQREGLERELKLKSTFFQPLIQDGAMLMRHDGTLESAQRVLERIFDPSKNVQSMEDNWMEGDTATRTMTWEEVELLVTKHDSDIAEVQAKMNVLENSNYEVRQELVANRAEMQQKLAKWEEDKGNLMRSLGALERAVEEQEQDQCCCLLS